MERIPDFQEKLLFNWSEHFIGNWDLFQKVLSNPETIFVYDVDGIIADTAEVVFKKFSQKNGIMANACDMNRWDYLSELARKSGLSEDAIKHADDDWYKPEILYEAGRCLYIRPTILKTIDFYGADKNFALTARNSDFRNSTVGWFVREIPEMKKENILIRDTDGIDLPGSAEFKVRTLRELSKIAPWVVFVDDTVDFAQAVLTSGIENCLVVNIPQGKIMPSFTHERMVVIKRYPEEYQALLPFMYAVFHAINVTQF